MKKNDEGKSALNRKKFHFDHTFFEAPRPYEHIILYQIGDLSCESGYVIGEHRQHCYEISYITSGEGLFFTNGQSYPVKKGDIYINIPGEMHDGIASRTDPFRYFYVGFHFADTPIEQNPFIHIKKMLDQIKNPVLQDRFNIHDPFISIFNEIINTGMYSDLMIKTYLQQIVVTAYRNFFESWEKEYVPVNESEKSRKIVYDIINYIDMHLCKIGDLTRIASELGYSYSYISRIFSNETGLGIHEYYNKKRFEKAVEWLGKGEMSVTLIAESLQYQSIHSFSRAFHKYFGMSPTEYQMIYNKSKKRTTESHK